MAPNVKSAPSPPLGPSKVPAKQNRVGTLVNAPRRTRTVRRRGRGRLDGIESDEEIERDVLSDASDSDEPSLVDSASESGSGSDAESTLLRSEHSHPDTPSTTQSPPRGGTVAAVALNGFSAPKPMIQGDTLALSGAAPALLGEAVTWPEMRAEDSGNGSSALPVIDFANLQEEAGSLSSEKEGKELQTETERGAGDVPEENQPQDKEGLASPRPSNRNGVQTTRQAYQQRLQSDPSFVPIVGDFWGHDDRLMHKDYRSLSSWWRGRWQGRGRAPFPTRGRGGNRGFTGSLGAESRKSAVVVHDDLNSNNQNPIVKPDIPPIERTWTHDGFEEMKAKEERRRTYEYPSRRSNSKQNGQTDASTGPSHSSLSTHNHGKGRAAHSSPSAHVRSDSPSAQPQSSSERTWYSMKPERIWTKQYERFLFQDPALRSKVGRAITYRVSFPGKGEGTVESSTISASGPEVSHSRAPSEVLPTSDAGSSKRIVVRIPKCTQGQTELHAFPMHMPLEQPEAFTTVEELAVGSPQEIPSSINEVGDQIVPEPSPPTKIPNSLVPTTLSAACDAEEQKVDVITPSLPTVGLNDNSTELATPIPISSQADMPSGTGKAEIEKVMPEYVLSGPVGPVSSVYPPSTAPSPQYGIPTPYAYAPPLPPGIALHQQGYAYEVASGRPVYLHPTPPPPPLPLFNTRPMPFVPGHLHHSSLSGDYLQQSSTPPLSGIVDPVTGRPIFSLPRQNSRIEIRAPSERQLEEKLKTERCASDSRSATADDSLRSNIAASQTFGATPVFSSVNPVPYTPTPEYFPGLSDTAGGAIPSSQAYRQPESSAPLIPVSEDPSHLQPEATMDQGVINYAGFHPQYYYPEQFYPAYLDFPQQHGQYNQYITNSRQHAPSPYY